MNEDYNESGGFLGGKGFYIALMLCVSVIALSAWMIVNGPEEQPEEQAAVTPAIEREQVISGAMDPVVTPVLEAEVPQLAEVTESVEAHPVQETAESTEPVVAVVSESVQPSYVWPLVGETDLPYSMDRLVYHETMGDWRVHDGIDIMGHEGEYIRAACNGTVTDVYSDDLYGTTVVIDHGEGLVSYYANLQEVPTVKTGDYVFGGDIIGAVGTSALCESAAEPHLHFAMSLNGQSVDPAAYLPTL